MSSLPRVDVAAQSVLEVLPRRGKARVELQRHAPLVDGRRQIALLRSATPRAWCDKTCRGSMRTAICN